MNVAVNNLAISFFKKPLTECSVADLKQLASQFPWFGPVQLLYAKKLQAGSLSIYEDQVQKTVLYFQNRLWLNHLLNETESSETITVSAPVAEEKAPINFTENAEPSSLEMATSEIITESAEIIIPPVEEKEPVDFTENSAPSSLEPATSEIITEPTELNEERPAETIEQKDEPVIDTPAETFTSVQYTSDEAAPAEQYTEDYNAVSLAETAAAETTTIPTDHPEESHTAVDMAADESPSDEKTEPLVELPPIKFQPINTMNAPLTFEPYHTIDYFASQGIKMIEDEKPKQPFDKQLKSFTEWLKAMKKVTAAEIASAPDSGGEKKVAQLAEHSLAERHIITEAMAQVWTKQGNTAKAEEIYRKLSLLDPQKTAYFAAKIEDLKKTS